MTLDNFMFTVSLFLCIKNKDKRKKIDYRTLIVVGSFSFLHSVIIILLL